MSPLMSRRLLLIWTVTVATELLVCRVPTAIARPADASDPHDVTSTSLVVNSRDEGTTELMDVFEPEREIDVIRKEIPAESENFVGRYVDSPTPDKNMRINTIRMQVETIRDWTMWDPTPSPTMKTKFNFSMLMPSVQQVDAMKELYENVQKAHVSDALTEKTQSFYPICEMPKNTNEEIWNSKESMNLMFNISIPRVANGVSVNMSRVKLRLFKQYVSCYSQTSNEQTDDTPQTSCQPTFLEDGVKRPANSSLSSSSSAEILPTSPDDRQIRVSVYVRSVKKKKVKRRLLDSRMISYYGEKWTEWNIYRAVKSWRSPVRSFALSVEIEDEYGNFLPVNRFFKAMNCTGDAQMTTPKPIPGFLIEAMHYGLTVNGVEATTNMSTAQALSLNMYRYPIVDVTTVESSEPEDASYRQTKDLFAQRMADAAQQTPVDGAPADRETSSDDQHRHHNHRIRHSGGGNRHKINSTDVQSAVAKLAKDQQQKQQQAAADAADGDSSSSENSD